ncbi:MAG: hypothetical protein JJ896_11835 [Rhodothermales bacterium]|nr:hypothetical protein [Rhodothermales bacterium]MBO6780335.1 hypothetical protein [Rhodothermales bacterium]
MSRLVLLPLFLALLITACDSNVMDDEDMMAMTTLRLEPVFDGQPLVMGSTYTHNGTAINFSAARVYISDITLIAEDGTETVIQSDPLTVPAKAADDSDVTHTVSNRVIFAKHDHAHHEYDLGHVPVGEYHGVEFNVGIAGTDNRIDATQVPASHPLAKQTDLNNHWSWSNGYIFVRLDGQVDSDGDGTPDTAWETHLGKDNFLREVHLHADFEVDQEGTTQIHVMLDYHKLLEGVDLADPVQRICHTGNNLPVANAVASEISGSFMFHGVHDSDHDGHDH